MLKVYTLDRLGFLSEFFVVREGQVLGNCAEAVHFVGLLLALLLDLPVLILRFFQWVMSLQKGFELSEGLGEIGRGVLVGKGEFRQSFPAIDLHLLDILFS